MQIITKPNLQSIRYFYFSSQYIGLGDDKILRNSVSNIGSNKGKNILIIIIIFNNIKNIFMSFDLLLHLQSTYNVLI